MRDNDSQHVTECLFEQLSEGVIKCAACDCVRKTTEAPERYHKLCSARLPKGGPGTEFKRLTTELQIRESKGCSCERLRVRMDLLGVEGCRNRLPHLVEEIKANADKWKWSEWLANVSRAAALAVAKGIPFEPLDPFGSLLREAIRRAELSH